MPDVAGTFACFAKWDRSWHEMGAVSAAWTNVAVR